MNTIFSKRNKIIALVILILAVGGYFGYQEFKPKESTTSYVTETASKGMLISSISGTGQVSALNQVDIKPKTSGDIISLNIKSGQEVKQDDLIAQIDSREAARKVSEARASLENAKLELEELLAPTDSYTLLQAENSLADALDSLAKLKLTHEDNYEQTLKDKDEAEDDLEEAYEDSFNTVVDVFLELPGVMTGLKSILFSADLSAGQFNMDYYASKIEKYDENAFRYRNTAYNSYQTARNQFDENFQNYKATSRYAEAEVLEELVSETYETVKMIAEAIRDANNLLDVYEDEMTGHNLTVPTLCATHQSNLNTYTSKTNSHLSSLLASERAIENYKEDILETEKDLEEMKQTQPMEIAQAERGIGEKQEKLNDLKEGATELEIKNKQLSIQQKENSLIEAQQNLADCYIRAPFDGMVVEVNIAKGDNVSGSTVIGTLITNQKIAEITLNEIDAANVKVGQKATLTFDAVPDLSITGEVVEVDFLGTVTQGVVSYDVKIAFDVQDERVKPGMSVSVNIITESKTDVLLVPISAVKTIGVENYVEVLVDEQLERKTITVGSSNDTMIEVLSGLDEGEEVITQTVSNGANSSSASQTQSSRRDGQPGGMMIFR